MLKKTKQIIALAQTAFKVTISGTLCQLIFYFFNRTADVLELETEMEPATQRVNVLAKEALPVETVQQGKI